MIFENPDLESKALSFHARSVKSSKTFTYIFSSEGSEFSSKDKIIQYLLSFELRMKKFEGLGLQESNL